MNKLIQEHTTRLGKIEGKRRWFTRIIAEGAGSSAIHTREALESTGPAAWASETHIHVDHQSWSSLMDFPANTLTTVAGIVASTPVFMEKGDTVQVGEAVVTADSNGLYAEVEFSEKWAPFVEEFADFIGLSISAGYYGEEYDETTNLPIVEGYIPSKLNTVDLVTVPGAKGKLLKAIESYSEKHDRIKLDNITSSKDGHTVTPEEIQEAVAKALEAFLPAIKEALTPDVEEDEDTPVETIAEAVATAALPEQARKRVYESIKSGVKVEDAIAAEQSYIKDLTESIKTEQKGRLTESSTSVDLSVGGWN